MILMKKNPFSTILPVLVDMYNSEHSAATSAVVFWTDVGEIMHWKIKNAHNSVYSNYYRGIL